MNNEEKIVARRKNLLPSLVFCLVHLWTFGGHPRRELQALGIEIETAQEEIDKLIDKGLLKDMITSYFGKRLATKKIVLGNTLFREAIVLTRKGKENIRRYDFQALLRCWIELNRL